jgi:hypothetical protein
MSDQSDDIRALKLRGFELEAELLFAQVRLRAFQDLAIMIWQSQGVKVHEEEPIEKVLRRLERDYADNLLRDYADKKPQMAAILRTLATRTFGTLPSTGADEQLGEP